jgi:hypothetical protein
LLVHRHEGEIDCSALFRFSHLRLTLTEVPE